MQDEKVRVTVTGAGWHNSGQSNQHQAQNLKMDVPFSLGLLGWYHESYLCPNGTVRDGEREVNLKS